MICLFSASKTKGIVVRNARLLFHLAFLAIWQTPAIAQPLLNPEDAVKIGLENNFGIRMARNDLIISVSNNSPGNAGFLPEMGVEASYQKSITSADVKVVSGTEMSEDQASTEWLDAAVYLDWTLFDGMKMFIRSDQLKKAEQAGGMALRIEMENIAADVIKTYHEIVGHRMLLEALRDRADLSRDRLRVVESQVSVGVASELELLKARVDLSADESAMTTQEARLQDAIILLNELLARDVRTSFNVQDTIILANELNIDTIRQYCLAYNSSLQLEGYYVELKEMDVKLMNADKMPVVSFNSKYYFSEINTEASFITYNRQRGPYFGFTAGMTLFDGMNKKRELHNAKVSLQNAELSRMQLANSLESSVATLYNQYKTNLRQIEVERENLNLAARNMDIAATGFAQGTVSSIDLREVQQSLLAAQGRLILSLYQCKASETELLRLSGKLL